MSDVKKPKAGEWWRMRNGVIRYVAADVSEIVNCEYPVLTISGTGGCSGKTRHGRNTVYDIGDYDLVEHLPDCTGFDWVSETFPQWYLHFNNKVVLKRTSSERVTYFENGEECDSRWSEWHTEQNFKTLTEAEALALLDPPKPVESPDDWVTQDRVPARNGIDQCWWARHGADQSDFEWWSIPDASEGKMYGDSHPNHAHLVLYIRCRRKDLPPLPVVSRDKRSEVAEKTIERIKRFDPSSVVPPQSQWQTIEIGGKRYEIREAQEAT